MSENQANNQGKPPWGRRPSGNSEFDARLREWQRKLEALLGGAGRGGGGSDGESGSGSTGGRGEGNALFMVLGAVLLALWVGSGFYQVKSAERGVIQRFGKYLSTQPEGWGWHLPWPIETVTKVNVQSVNSSDYESRVLTADVNLVDLRFVVQYRFSDPVKMLFRVRDPKATLHEVSESAIREIVGQSNLEDVLVGATRPAVTRRSKELIQRTLDFYNTGITVTSVNLTDVQVPEAVIPSQRDANKALADQERFVKEAQAYANGIVPVAQGAAARMQQDAEAYKARVVAVAEGEAGRFSQLATAYAAAPEVTRKRLYLETVESVLARTRKVVVDSKSANGNMLYLPLDKLMERSAAAPRSEESAATSAAGAEMDTVTVDGRSRAER
jgi:modulator of FtsH protease HflK